MRLFALLALVTLGCAYAAVQETTPQTVQVVFDLKAGAGRSEPQKLVFPVVGSLQFTNVSSNGDVTLCFQRTFSAEGWCTVTVSNPAPGSALDLKSTPIYAGVYYVSATTTSTADVRFNATITYAMCKVDEMSTSDGKDCVAAKKLAVNDLVPFSCRPGTPTKVHWTVEFARALFPKQMSAQFQGTAPMTRVATSAFFGVNNINPAESHALYVSDMSPEDHTYSYAIPSNIPGANWYFETTVECSAAGDFNITLDDSSAPCTNGTNPTCLNLINNLGSTGEYRAITGTVGADFVFAILDAKQGPPRLSASTATGGIDNRNLSVYIASGYVPFRRDWTQEKFVVADWQGKCTLPAAQCAQVLTMDLPSSEQPYYIALIYDTPKHVSTGYVLYESSSAKPCPPCKNGGTCVADPKDAMYGRCKCTGHWVDVNCNTVGPPIGVPSTPKSQKKIIVIVLAVVGSLLGITGVIAIIGCFINKKNASGEGYIAI